LVIITFIIRLPEYHIKNTYGKRPCCLLGFVKPQKLLFKYIKVILITFGILIVLWLITGPVAGIVNKYYTNYRLDLDLDSYFHSVKFIENSEDWPPVPDMTFRYIIIPDHAQIEAFIDLFKDWINN
jgi:hypothetical protein